MNLKEHNRLKARAEIIKSLAHPTRLFIVEELKKGERCVCELTEMLDVDVSTVSKHLSVLKKAGIVQDRKKGLKIFYKLKCPCICNFWECIESVLQSNISDHEDLK